MLHGSRLTSHVDFMFVLFQMHVVIPSKGDILVGSMPDFLIRKYNRTMDVKALYLHRLRYPYFQIKKLCPSSDPPFRTPKDIAEKTTEKLSP